MKYEDIINMDRPKSKYPKMSIENRSAQFAPFSALSGYDEAIMEMGRMTTSKHILSLDEQSELNDKLTTLKNEKNIEVEITYFVKDSKKDGGKYITSNLTLKRIDEEGYILFTNRKKILLKDILDIKKI